jgi:Calx-beta domain
MPRLIVLTLVALALTAAPASAAVTVAPASGAEGDAVTFTVTRDSLLETATATTTPGTADAGDFTPLSGENVAFGVAMTATVSVATTEDVAAEPDETFTLTVDASLGADAAAPGTIVDDDPRALSIRDATVSEAAGAVDVVVEALPASGGAPASTVPFATAPGSAADGQDFTPTSGTLTMPAGASRATIRIPIANDTADEDDDAFTVNLGAPAGATVADGQATVTIANDDLRALSVGDVTVAESDGPNAVARVPITLNAPTFRAVTVQYATIDGLARAPRDFLARFGSVTIPAGQTSALVDLAIVSDDARERREAFGLLIGRPVGATIAKQAAAVTIDDDDGPASDDVPPNMRVTRVRLSGSRITARVSCPRGEQRCRGRLTFFTRPDRRSPSRTLRRERRIGRASYTLRGGRARTVRVTIPRAIRSAARRARRLRVRAFAVTDDANGNTDTTTKSATLRVRR